VSYRRLVEPGSDREVVDPVRAAGLELSYPSFEHFEARRYRRVSGNVEQSLGEDLPHREVRGRGPNGVFHPISELVVRLRSSRKADDTYPFVEALLAMKFVERGHELAARKVAGCAEDDEARRRLGQKRHSSPLPQDGYFDRSNPRESQRNRKSTGARPSRAARSRSPIS
jgi:hypothetical protein